MFIVYLPVLKVPVDLLGFIEQVEHLPQSKLKIHLPEVKYPPQILEKYTWNTNSQLKSHLPEVEYPPQILETDTLNTNSKLKIHLSEVIRRRYKRQIHQVQIGRIENSLYTRMTPSSTELPINNGTLTFTWEIITENKGRNVKLFLGRGLSLFCGFAKKAKQD